jgi:hypothetical protein
VSSPLLIVVLAIVGFYLIAGLLRYIRQEWRSVAASIRQWFRGKAR